MEALFLNHLYIGVGLPVARQVKFTLSNSSSTEAFAGCTVILTSVPLHSAEIRNDYAVDEFVTTTNMYVYFEPL